MVLDDRSQRHSSPIGYLGKKRVPGIPSLEAANYPMSLMAGTSCVLPVKEFSLVYLDYLRLKSDRIKTTQYSWIVSNTVQISRRKLL